ncbi:uncharacterized protein LOC110376334 isoform X1 [Helicoverpa armigera]|uniref:Uncharacterized protein n=1 Tax=Helicoverpa armigera TaxID=29058 RepID=A0A2W1BWD9_HELAM|nr:uncharacterized protein LOC124635476 [Helicoverpa zea]PZC77934.1 hypothetical protein B5X24_HaOG202741 [Helicoverpa armigera]
MTRSAFTVAILVLVVAPAGRRAAQGIAKTRVLHRTKGPLEPPGSRIFPRQAQHEEAAPYVGDSYLSLRDKLLYSVNNGESTEEQQGYTYNSYYAPSRVNFHDIYSNRLSMLAEDPMTTTARDDETFHLQNIPTKYVEFHPKTQTVPPITSPSPMFLLNSSFIKNQTEPQHISKISSTTSTTTEEPEEASVKVIPIKVNYQRGVLDLLFPAARVRTFKSVFDTFRRLMSHTFR